MDRLTKPDTIYAEAGSEKRTQRILSAGTLPSILRILTDVHTATQYDLWSFLLHVRQYSTAKYILEFLRRRYLLTHAGVHETAEELAAEEGPIATDAWEDARHEKFTWMESQLKRHVLGSELFRATTKELAIEAVCKDKESRHRLSECYVEIKLGVLFLLETWLSYFPEDFIGAPEEHIPDGVETEVKDDWHHRPTGPGSSDPAGSHDDAPPDIIRQPDALDLLVDLVENALLPCPMMLLLGASHLWMPAEGVYGKSAAKAADGVPPFEAAFPCIYKVASAVHLDLHDESSARMLSMDPEAGDRNVVKSYRNDGYDKSIIPLAIVLCSINARSRMKRISQSDMEGIYESIDSGYLCDELGGAPVVYGSLESRGGTASQHMPATPERSESCSVLNPVSGSSLHSAMGRRLSRRHSYDGGEAIEFSSWYKSEMLQLSELRTSITQILGTESMRCMRLIMEQYHPLVVILRAAEMAAAENYDNELPVKVFVTPIDKQVLTYMYSKTKGFSTVAASMVALKHHFDESNKESNIIGVNLIEAMRGYDSADSDAESSQSGEGNSRGGVLVSGNGSRLSPDSPPLPDVLLTGRESTAIVVNDELGKALHDQAKEEKKTLVRPWSLWKRRQKRKELQKKLDQWKEENHVPSGIDTCQGPAEVLKARAVRGLTQTCKSSVLFQFAPSLLAYNMTLKLHYLYSVIPLLEFTVHAGFSARSRREVPMLARFRHECDRLQEMFVDEILSESEPMSRATLIMNLIQLGEAAARMWSHHLLMLVVQALQCHSIHRLKETWKLVENALPGAWAGLQDCTGFGGSTLLNSQMEKFLNFGFAEDYRKNICIYKPENLVSNKDDDCIQDLVDSIERSVTRASLHGYLVSSKDVIGDKNEKTDTKTALLKRPSKISAPSWFSHKKLSDSLKHLPEDRLYLGCCYSETGADTPSIAAGRPTDKALGLDRPVPAVVDECCEISDAISVLNMEEAGTRLMSTDEIRLNVVDSKVAVDIDDNMTDESGEPSSQESIGSTRQESMSSGVASHCFLKGSTSLSAYAAGIVRDDAAADLLGLAKPTPQAGMPYVNSIMSKLIRLCDLPEYMRDAENPDNVLLVSTPGLFESDQKLPMINFGKLRSIARWMLLLRCTQLTPFRFDEKAVILDLHTMLLKPSEYRGQDMQWERSLFLEKKKP